jgi:hypothetical protein
MLHHPVLSLSQAAIEKVAAALKKVYRYQDELRNLRVPGAIR